MLVRLERVEAVVLEHVRPQLVREADASPLVSGGVHEDASTLGGDGAERLPQLHPAIAPERSERVARQAFRMEPHQDVFAVSDLAPAHAQLYGAVPVERPRPPFAERGRQRELGDLGGEDAGRHRMRPSFPGIAPREPPRG